MSPEVAALIGAAIGSLGGVAATLIAHVLDARRERARRLLDDKAKRDEALINLYAEWCSLIDQRDTLYRRRYWADERWRQRWKTGPPPEKTPDELREHQQLDDDFRKARDTSAFLERKILLIDTSSVRQDLVRKVQVNLSYMEGGGEHGEGHAEYAGLIHAGGNPAGEAWEQLLKNLSEEHWTLR
jgi:hypothetical protein